MVVLVLVRRSRVGGHVHVGAVGEGAFLYISFIISGISPSRSFDKKR